MASGNEENSLAVDLLGESGPTAPNEPRLQAHKSTPSHSHTRIARALRSLLAYPRVAKLYPPGHQRVEAHFNELLNLVASIFDEEELPIVVTVIGNGVHIDGEALEGHAELTSTFALKLRRRQIRSLTLRPGIDRAEIEGLAALLAADHKELLRRDGPEAFLPGGADSCLGLATFATNQDGDSEKYEGGGGELPAGVAAALENCLKSPETAAHLERLRSKYETLLESATQVDLDAEVCDFDDLVYELFGRPEWAQLEVEQVQQAFDVFLKLFEETLPDTSLPERLAIYARIESIRSFFREISPEELLAEEEIDTDEVLSESTVAYSPKNLENRHGSEPAVGREAAEALRAQIERHNHEENSLLILCELMVSADDIDQYERRRGIFLGAFADRRYASASIARLLRYIAIDLPSPRFENRDNLVHAVFDSTADEEALVLFLESMTSQPDVARPILSRLVMRHDPFPLLVRLLRAERLAPFRRVLTDKLLQAARVKQEALILWARRNRDLFFRQEVFEPLFQKAPELLGAICKEILTEGPAADRGVLINRLKDEKNETALRLLVLGMPPSDETCDELLLRALAGFRHPLAVAALREIVHRSNTSDVRVGEALSAMRALAVTRMEDGHAFLWEVVQKRSCLLPLYRKPLRQFASQLLSGMDN
jgi:hypothetical protein